MKANNTVINMNKKLYLNKQKISILNGTKMDGIIGGKPVSTNVLCYPSVRACPTGYTIDVCDL